MNDEVTEAEIKPLDTTYLTTLQILTILHNDNFQKVDSYPYKFHYEYE